MSRYVETFPLPLGWDLHLAVRLGDARRKAPFALTNAAPSSAFGHNRLVSFGACGCWARAWFVRRRLLLPAERTWARWFRLWLMPPYLLGVL